MPDHPLIAHKLSVLRDRRTNSATFRAIVSELMTLLAYEATRTVTVEPVTIETPIATAQGRTLAGPRPVVVPILRAGLGMLDGMTELLPTAEVGFLGMQRDDDTLKITTYANRLPENLADRQCFILDPMLATGSTIITAVEFLLGMGARDVTVVSLVAAAPGLTAVEEAVGHRANVTIVVAAVDPELNERNYIVPGLGDAGDRLYGIVK